MGNKTIIDEHGIKRCKCFKRCGGCQLDMSYEKQLEWKQDKAQRMLSRFSRVEPIIACEDPYNYRCKVQNVYAFDRSKRIISGIYQSSSGKMTAVSDCFLEDRRAQRIVGEFKKLMHDFKLMPYDAQTGRGLVRHTLIRTSVTTGQIMLVIVTASPVFPAKKNFVGAMLRACPEITTIVQNISNDRLALKLGARSNVLYGKGYIEDELCDLRFRISPESFYQVCPQQTEKLYRKVLEYLSPDPEERIIDAYCGTGTIGMAAAADAGEVIGVELNPRAVKDAAFNAKRNGIGNISFVCADAGDHMRRLAAQGERVGAVIMDPPRAGASKQFIEALGTLRPRKLIYVSCKIETLERDLRALTKLGYKAQCIQPVDMFPHTTGIENVVSLRLTDQNSKVQKG